MVISIIVSPFVSLTTAFMLSSSGAVHGTAVFL